MGLIPHFSTIYYGNKVLNMMGIDTTKIKEQINDAIKDYATKAVSNVSPDTINEKVENLQIDTDLTPEEQQERAEKVEALQQVFNAMGDNYVENHENATEEDKPYQNVVEAIDENPEAWGQLLDNGNVSLDTLNNMAEAAEAGNPPPAMDMVRLVYGASSGAISSFTEKYADAEPQVAEAVNDGTQTDTATKRAAQADALLPESASTDTSFELNA